MCKYPPQQCCPAVSYLPAIGGKPRGLSSGFHIEEEYGDLGGRADRFLLALQAFQTVQANSPVN